MLASGESNSLLFCFSTSDYIMGIRKLGEREGLIDRLIENPNENLELIGLYITVLKLAEKGEIEKAEEFLRGL